METIVIVNNELRDLTTAENFVKVILGTAAAFIAKRIVEGAVEDGFRRYR